jgi:Flp pilus assembly protein TadG
MTLFRGSDRGQSLVEMALLLPVLILILMVLFDFGRAVFAFNTVSNASREGARIAIVDQTVASGISVGAQEAANQATSLGLDPADTNQVAVTYLLPDLSGPCPDRGIGCIARVTVKYQFFPITPVIGRIFGPFTLSSTSQIPIENTKP